MNEADEEFDARDALFVAEPPVPGSADLGDLPLTAPALERWLEVLPVDDPYEVLRQLLEAVQRVNRAVVTPDARFDFLEAVRHPALSLFGTLRQRFALEGRYYDQRLFTLASYLLSELMIGYRLVLREDGAASRGFFAKPAWLLAHHRLIDYCGTVLRLYRLANLRSPTGVWLRAHRIYRRAAENGWHTRKVPYIPGAHLEQSIERSYKHTLLLALLTPENDCRELYELLHELIGEWTEEVHLALPEHGGLRHYPVRILSGRDARPRVLLKEVAARVEHLKFDYRPLLKRLEKLVARASDGQVELSGHGRVSADLLQLTLDRLRIISRQREEREPSGRYFNVLVGVGSIHEHLQRVEGRQLTSVMWEAGMDTPLAGQGPAGESCELDDLRGSDSVLGQALNESPNGCCLAIPRKTAEVTEIGDLVALRAQHDTTWRLGVIRWLQSGAKGQVLCGVEIVAERPVPFELVVLGEHAVGAPVRALLALDHGRGPILLSPYLPGLTSKPLGLMRQRQPYAIRLGRRRMFSTAFEVHDFIELRAMEKQHYIADVLALLRQAVTPKGNGEPTAFEVSRLPL